MNSVVLNYFQCFLFIYFYPIFFECCFFKGPSVSVIGEGKLLVTCLTHAALQYSSYTKSQKVSWCDDLDSMWEIFRHLTIVEKSPAT